LNEAKKFLPKLEKSVENYKSQIKIKTAERKVQHTKYLQLKREWEETIAFLKSFLKLLQENIDGKGGISLVELNENLIKRVGKLGRLEKLAPIFLEMYMENNEANSSSDDNNNNKNENEDNENNNKNGKSDNENNNADEQESVGNNTVISNTTNVKEVNSTLSKIVNKTVTETDKITVNRTKTVTTSKSMTEKLERIRKLVSDLNIKLTLDAKQNDEDEENALKNFNSLIAQFNKIIQQLEINIAKVTKQITEMNLCVKNEMDIMIKATQKQTRNEKLLKIADNTCSDFVKEFVKATKDRLKQIQAVRDILMIIRKRFGEFPPELVKLLNNLTTEFKQYINTTEFKSYEELAKKKIADNERGKELSTSQALSK